MFIKLSQAVTQYSCMICSAKDEETIKVINACRNIINHWNEINSTDRNISFVSTGQDISTVPGVGRDAQSVIDDQALKAADIGIVIFETNKGSSYQGFKTATEYELDKLQKLGKNIAVYIRNDSKLNPIKERIRAKKSILYTSYKTINELKLKLHDFLDKTANKAANCGKYESPQIATQELFLSEDLRRVILNILSEKEKVRPSEIAKAVGVAEQSTRSSFKALVDFGYVTKEEIKRKVFYSIVRK